MNFHPADVLGHIWDITWAHWVFGLTECRPGPESAALQGRRSPCSSEMFTHTFTHATHLFFPLFILFQSIIMSFPFQHFIGTVGCNLGLCCYC